MVEPTSDVSREGNLLAGFALGVVMSFVGVAADDLRILAIIGVPITATCFSFLRNKQLAPAIVLALIALRSAVALIATGNPWMAFAAMVSAGLALILVRMASKG